MYVLSEIKNRTENWKTARSFAHLLLDSHDRAELAKKLGEDPGTSRGDVDIQLFWKGMRDYVYKMGKPREKDLRLKCTDAYKKLFPQLRGDLKRFSDQCPHDPLQAPSESDKISNYDPSYSEESKEGLFNNLRNTEIDIVLETPGNLYIGEAKGEAGLGADGGLVLVHQLIRQYVTAKILLHLIGQEKRIVPFMVVEEKRRDSIMNTGQVKFMTDVKGCLKKENVLTWDYFERLHP